MDRRDELIRAGLVLASELSLPAVLQRIIELAAEITGARYGALGVIEEGRLTDFITIGLTPEEREAIGDLPVGHGILGVLIHRGKDRTPVRIPDINKDPRRHGFPPHHPPIWSPKAGRRRAEACSTSGRSTDKVTCEGHAAFVPMSEAAEGDWRQRIANVLGHDAEVREFCAQELSDAARGILG